MHNLEFKEIFGSLKTFILDESELEPLEKTNQSGVFNSFYGKKHTEETKKKWSIKRKGTIIIYDKSGKNNPNYGKYGKDSPNYGKKRSVEFKLAQSKQFSGKNNPMFGIEREKHPSSKFTDIELKQIYELFKNGMTRTEIFNFYNGKYSSSTIKRAIRNHD